MNLILLFPSDFLADPSVARLTGRRHHHVLEILKPKLGDTLTVGVENGRIGQGKVTKLDARSLELEVALVSAPPAKLPVIFCCALMRPIVLKRVLQTVTAMGVSEIHLFHSRQVEKSFWQSTALKDEAIHEELILGLEQSRDTVLPKVFQHKRFKPFVEDVLPGLLKGRCGIVADPSGGALGKVSSGSSVVVIGPEGGLIPFEVEKFREAGCQVVGLGERILKVETAAVSLLSKLS